MRIDCHNHIGVELLQYLTGGFPYGQHWIALVNEGTRHGVDRWIVFPMVSNLTFDLPSLRDGRIEPGGIETVPYAFENRRMMEEIEVLFPVQRNRAFPFVMLDPAREVASQVTALRDLRQRYPFDGFKLQTTMIRSPVRSLLDTGRSLLDLAEEWDLPLLIHSSVNPDDPWAQAADIVDVVESNPRLRFCVAHSLRFDFIQLNRLAELPHCWFDCSAHRIHCQLATEDHPAVAPPGRRFPSDYRWPEVVLADLAQAYPDRLLWGSDSPYYSYADREIQLFSSYAEEIDCLNALAPAVQKQIAFENTLRFLGRGKSS